MDEIPIGKCEHFIPLHTECCVSCGDSLETIIANREWVSYVRYDAFGNRVRRAPVYPAKGENDERH